MKMSKQKFQARWENAREQAATGYNRVKAKLDQTVSKLFYDSEWTQQDIADEIGKSQQWVGQRLLFGRFLTFLTTNVVKLPVNLTEGKFRGFWAEHGGKVTANTPAETKRFQAIIDCDEWQMSIADKPAFKANDGIKENCCGNKWWSKDEVKFAIGAPDHYTDKQLTDVIGDIKTNYSGGLMCVQKGTRYRFKKVKNKDSMKVKAITVVDELEPIVEDIYKALQLKTDHDKVGYIRGHMSRLKSLVKKYS